MYKRRFRKRQKAIVSRVYRSHGGGVSSGRDPEFVYEEAPVRPFDVGRGRYIPGKFDGPKRPLPPPTDAYWNAPRGGRVVNLPSSGWLRDEL